MSVDFQCLIALLHQIPCNPLTAHGNSFVIVDKVCQYQPALHHTLAAFQPFNVFFTKPV